MSTRVRYYDIFLHVAQYEIFLCMLSVEEFQDQNSRSNNVTCPSATTAQAVPVAALLARAKIAQASFAG